jgi:hypothetical protein
MKLKRRFSYYSLLMSGQANQQTNSGDKLNAVAQE